MSQNRYSSPDSSIHTALNSCQYDKPYSQGPPSFPITCSAQLSCCFSALQATGSWVGGPESEARWDEIMCIGHPIVEMVDETLQIEADLGLILINEKASFGVASFPPLLTPACHSTVTNAGFIRPGNGFIRPGNGFTRPGNGFTRPGNGFTRPKALLCLTGPEMQSMIKKSCDRYCSAHLQLQPNSHTHDLNHL